MELDINVFHFTQTRRSDQVPQGTLACSGLMRQWASLSLNDEVDVVVFDPSSEGSQYFLQKMTLEIDMITKGKRATDPFDSQEMTAVFAKVLTRVLLSPDLHWEEPGISSLSWPLWVELRGNGVLQWAAAGL